MPTFSYQTRAEWRTRIRSLRSLLQPLRDLLSVPVCHRLPLVLCQLQCTLSRILCLCLALPDTISAEFEGQGAVLKGPDAMIKRPCGPLQDIAVRKKKETTKVICILRPSLFLFVLFLLFLLIFFYTQYLKTIILVAKMRK